MFCGPVDLSSLRSQVQVETLTGCPCEKSREKLEIGRPRGPAYDGTLEPTTRHGATTLLHQVLGGIIPGWEAVRLLLMI
jgi:hypothetical protein